MVVLSHIMDVVIQYMYLPGTPRNNRKQLKQDNTYQDPSPQNIEFDNDFLNFQVPVCMYMYMYISTLYRGVSNTKKVC